MNHNTKYSIMTIGLLLGICFFTIVISTVRENKFGKGDGSNFKGGINKENESSNDTKDDFTLSQDSNDSFREVFTEKISFNFSSDQIKELDFNFKNLADFLEIKDQSVINKLFENLYKAEPEERLEIFEKYKQNIGKVDDFVWVKEGLQAYKNFFINFVLIIKFTVFDWIYFCGGWIAENVIRGKKNVND